MVLLCQQRALRLGWPGQAFGEGGNMTWQFVRKGCKVIDERGRKIADISVAYCGEAELMKRGKTIAAAPQLKEALEETGLQNVPCQVTGHMDERCSSVPINTRCTACFVRAALAAAGALAEKEESHITGHEE